MRSHTVGGRHFSKQHQRSRHKPHPSRHARPSLQQTHAVREPKDPKAFKDMDEVRAYLHAERPGFISGALNLLSNSAFGRAGLDQPWWSPARLYRHITNGLMPPDRLTSDDEREGDQQYSQAVQETHKQLGPLLMLSKSDIRRMARRYPQVLTMPASEVASRLLDLREVLPGCDVCLLIYMSPELFLSGDARLKRQQLEAASSQLHTRLKGARIAEVIMFDPEVLFMDLSHGLDQLCELWDVDEQCMAASEPRHLATAIRALCVKKGQRVRGV